MTYNHQEGKGGQPLIKGFEPKYWLAEKCWQAERVCKNRVGSKLLLRD
jgi:hypothetical protein